MNDKNDLNYLFWLDSWTHGYDLLPVYGRYRCLVNKFNFIVENSEVEASEKFVFNIDAIVECRVGYPIKGTRGFVELKLKDRVVTLFPVNPFDPYHVIYTNRDEAHALVDLINYLILNLDFNMEANPFLRQSLSKMEVARLQKIDKNLYINMSPWEYYDTYGEKRITLKVALGILIGLVLAAPFIIAIAYFAELIAK